MILNRRSFPKEKPLMLQGGKKGMLRWLRRSMSRHCRRHTCKISAPSWALQHASKKPQRFYWDDRIPRRFGLGSYATGL